MIARPETPARRMFGTSEDGLIRVGATALTYADGSEARMLNLISTTTDLGSRSMELLDRAEGWAERYHSHPARANVLRALDVPRDATALEIGAGCGAVTRYLGETVAILDALEPMEARARVARARTRDLSTVEVLVGELTDLPREPGYDLVVIVGVLEYVGLGSRDAAPYRDFLAEVAARLKPGGQVVLAIENKLGVKYLVGAPEDHTSQIFDSIEGYPRGERARTFSRRELEALFRDAGLSPRTLAAFPDYKLTRTVFDAAAFDCESIHGATAFATFPSPDWTVGRPRLASERLVWEQFAEAGLAHEVANSLVVIASPTGATTLWPTGRRGIAFDPDARRDPELAIAELTADAPAPSPTRNLIDVIAESSIDRRRELMSRWRDGLAAGVIDGESPSFMRATMDSSGSVTCHFERNRADGDAATLVDRALLTLGIDAAKSTPPSLWPGAQSVNDIVGHLHSLLDQPDDEVWLAAAVEAETRSRSTSSSLYPEAEAAERHRDDILRDLATNLDDTELGIRLTDDATPVALRAQLQASQNMLADAQREVERLRLELAGRPQTARGRIWGRSSK